MLIKCQRSAHACEKMRNLDSLMPQLKQCFYPLSEDNYWDHVQLPLCRDVMVLSIIVSWRQKCLNVVMDMWRFQTIRLLGENCSFFSSSGTVKQSGNYIYHWPLCAHHLPWPSRLYRSSSRRGWVCETGDTPASFTSNAWKHFDLIFKKWETLPDYS